jgi:hypothetical protein
MKKKIYSYFIQQTVASASEGELTIIFFFRRLQALLWEHNDDSSEASRLLQLVKQNLKKK